MAIDLCRCQTTECKYYKSCFRGNGHSYKPGIYTFSNLGDICKRYNKDSKFDYFIKGDVQG